MIRFLQHQTKTKKLFLGAILAVLILGMVLYLGAAFTNSSAAANVQGVYAKVGEQEITTQQIANEAKRLSSQQFPQQAVPEFLVPYFQKNAADNLVVQAALVEEAGRMGLKVTDQELQDELQHGFLGRAVFPSGNFIGKEKYAEFIADNYRLDVPSFERLVKLDLVIRKLQSVVQGSVVVNPDEVQREFNKQSLKVKFDYAVLSTAELVKKISANEAELQAYYDKNKARYSNSIPEQRKASYVVIDSSKVPVTISEDDYKRAYNERQEQFREKEQVDVRHILVKTKDLALDIEKQLKAGAKFQDLAKKYSEDPGSKDKGGLYEGVVRNQMVPEFDKAAFSQEPGKISDPVGTSFGFHIIRVDAHRQASLKPIEKVKSELEPAIKAQKAAAQVNVLADAVLADANKDGLSKAAAQHGLGVVNTDYFPQTASLPGVGKSPSFMQQLFGAKVKGTAEKINLGEGFAIAEVLDAKPSSTPTFAQARAQVEQQFKSERANEMLGKKTKELSDRARSLKNLKAAAKEVGATVKTSDLVSSSSQVPDLGSMSGPASVAFTMSPGQISDPINAGGSGVVIALLQSQEPSAAEFAQQKEPLRENLLQRKRAEIMQVFAENLRNRMRQDGTIRVNDKEEKRLLGSQAGS